jgi:hypothetical protein
MKEEKINLNYYISKEEFTLPVYRQKGFQDALSKYIPNIKDISLYRNANSTNYFEVITMTNAFVFHIDDYNYAFDPRCNESRAFVQISLNESLTAELRKELLKDVLTFDFGKALEHLKQGKAIARKGWNGKGLFVYMVSGGTYKVQMDIVKPLADSNNCMTYEPYFAIWNGRGTINTWVPSVSDLLAEDYIVIEDTKEYVENAKNRN